MDTHVTLLTKTMNLKGKKKRVTAACPCDYK